MVGAVAIQAWNIGKVCFEADTEPYSIQRDQRMIQNVEAAGVPWHSFVSHTLYVRSAGNTVPDTLSLCST